MAKKGNIPWNKGIKTGKSTACPDKCECERHTPKPCPDGCTCKRHQPSEKLGKILAPFSENHRSRIGEANRRRTYIKGRRNSVETKELMRERRLQAWQNPEYAHKVLSANGQRPNKAEIKCLEQLEEKEPGVWKYVGDGQLIIGGKSPDFWDGGTRLVEMYGDYWHGCLDCFPNTDRHTDPQERIDFFKEHGYECQIIWEHEL